MTLPEPKTIPAIALTVIGLLLVTQAHADVVMRMSFQHGPDPTNDVDDVDIRLLTGPAPVTVTNFLNYVRGTTVNGGSFDNTFLSRIDSGFVIQTGGFSFDPTVGDGSFSASFDSVAGEYVFNGGLQPVSEDDPIQNEYNLPNTRGTLAMAKVPQRLEDAEGNPCPFQSTTCFVVPGTGPNSATSQWFINLTDNSSTLGTSNNGGFSVFGEVINGTMSIVDSLATTPVFDKTDIHSAMGTLPLTGYTSGNIQQQHLVRQSAVEELFDISPDPDFGVVLNGTYNEYTLRIDNTSSSSLMIGSFTNTADLSAPFSIVSNNCENTTLAMGASCEATIAFEPATSADYVDSFSIGLPLLPMTLDIEVLGSSADSIEPDIAPNISIADFGEQPIYDPLTGVREQIVIYVNNEGNTGLSVGSAIISGPDSADFEFTDNCSGRTIDPGDFCVLPVNFVPLTEGTKTATLSITSDDPDENTLDIPLTGIASQDIDSVPYHVEQAHPNHGDGNNDGEEDGRQSNVASFPDASGEYSTIVTASSFIIRNLEILNDGEYPPAPANTDFEFGVYSFDIDTDLFTGALVEFGLIQPAGTSIREVYSYTSTADDSTPRWRLFDYRDSTGSNIVGQVTLIAPDSSETEGNLVRVFAIDGGRGDGDNVADGKITVMIAPVRGTAPNDDENALLLSPCLLFVLLTVVRAMRRRPLRVSPHGSRPVGRGTLERTR